MPRVCSIHQPSYWPYLGLFDKVRSSDVFVFLDDVQYVKNDFKNRNRVFVNSVSSENATRTDWITLPVRHTTMSQTIQQTRVLQPTATLRKHLKTITQAYSHTEGMAELGDELSALFQKYSRDDLPLAEINMATTCFAFEVFGIKTEVCGVSSAIKNKSAEPTQRLIDICRAVGADTYLAGVGGKDYMRVEEFERHGIALEWQDWKPFAYPQVHSPGEFVPFLSCLDLILNRGTQSRKSFSGVK